MMRREFICLLAAISVFICSAGGAYAGALIEINEQARIDLGFRLQTLYLNTEDDLDGDGEFESSDDFKVRRARLRVGADITRWVSAFLQTEAIEAVGTGTDMRVIDAYIQLKPHPLANLFMGEHMAPVTRQNLTSSGGLMAIDRPGLTYKNLTWGTRALSKFSNETYGDSDAGLRGGSDVRDTGATLFGSESLNDEVHFKYYLGAYDGVQESDEDSARIAGRVQINFFEAEPGYFNLSTYLGKKKTVGLGAAFDSQNDVARDLDADGNADYFMYTVDAFADYPVGPGHLTVEAGYLDLDLDDAARLDTGGDEEPSDIFDARQAQGDGFYAQAGYFYNNWQPWIEYETWDSDGPGDLGSYHATRFGLSYFISGHNANIKAGYEIFEAEENFTDVPQEDSIGTFVAGLYVTY